MHVKNGEVTSYDCLVCFDYFVSASVPIQIEKENWQMFSFRFEVFKYNSQ